ncbi:MAG: HEPN domain-containing protein [Bacteroidales bacterium]|nr:HEPN domain-containing protein [Bacteroidales bacterium]
MPFDEISEFTIYRLKKSDEVYEAAVILYNAGQWNSAVNRLYYACFYAASALLLKRGIGAKSHSGVIAKFSENVVRSGEMPADTYRVYSKLLNWRAKGDYSDMFDFSKEDVEDVLEPAKSFIEAVKMLLK